MKKEHVLQPSGRLPATTCMLRGHLATPTMATLSGCPTFESNGIAQIPFQADVVDGHGSLLKVTVWDANARGTLMYKGSGLLALWADCADEAGQAAFLTAMKTSMDKDFDLDLEIALREWKGNHSYLIHANAARDIPIQ